MLYITERIHVYSEMSVSIDSMLCIYLACISMFVHVSPVPPDGWSPTIRNIDPIHSDVNITLGRNFSELRRDTSVKYIENSGMMNHNADSLISAIHHLLPHRRLQRSISQPSMLRRLMEVDDSGSVAPEDPVMLRIPFNLSDSNENDVAKNKFPFNTEWPYDDKIPGMWDSTE
jgi:hypothetical protein